MGHVHETIEINAPMETVWALAADARRLPEWQGNVVEVKGISGAMDEVGTKYTSVGRLLGRQLEATFEITKVDKPHLLENKGTIPGGGHGSGSFHLEPHGTGTTFTVDIDVELPLGILGGVVDRLFAERTLERDIHHGLETLKALCEAEARVPTHA